MKKFLRALLIILLVLLLIVVIAGLMAPKESNITSTVEINAPKEQVWQQMVVVKNNKNWSPFTEQEPGIALTYAGVDGQPGSSYHWKGEKMGEGTMTLRTVTGTSLVYDLDFVKPFAGKADGTMAAEDAGEGKTKATWTLHVVNDKFFMRGVGYLMEMMGMGMQKAFDKGTQNLKNYVEAHKSDAPPAPAWNVQEVQFPGHTYAGIRKTVKMDDIAKFSEESLTAVGKAAGARIAGPPSGIYYSWDTVKHETDVFVGFPVSDNKPVAGATIVTLPASKGYMLALTGSYDQMPAAHEHIQQHMAGKSTGMPTILEEYVKMAPEEKDMNKWVTNIYYLVK